MITPQTVFKLRDVRDQLEDMAQEVLENDGMTDDFILIGRAYHLLASQPEIGYRAELDHQEVGS